MYSQLYIIISLSTYLIGCYVLERYERPYTKQRQIALVRTMNNFLVITAISVWLSYIGYTKIPVLDRGWIGDVLTLVIWVMLSEAIFSLAHYTFHNKYLYRWIHKQHHENNPSYSTSSLDCHWLEFIIANVGAVLLPMVWLPASANMSACWILFATLNTCFAHSQAGNHTIHHTDFIWNYGQGIYAFDKIMGTYKN